MTFLNIEPLGPAAFAPFGTVVQTAAAADGAELVNAGTSQRQEILPALDLHREGGRAVLAVYQAVAQRLPLQARELERHRLSDQVFLPLGTALRCVLLVAPAGSTPDPTRLRAFVSEGRQGVCIRAGTWHHGLISLDAGPWAVLERRALDDTVDCEVSRLALGVTLALTGEH